GRSPPASARRTRAERPKPPNLSPDASESLRHQLISELEHVEGPDALASWAHRSLPLKNQLTTADDEVVEAAFAVRLTQLSEPALMPRPKNHMASGHGGQ